MPVVVDNEQLDESELGLRTFGHVLAHLQRENRLVVHVLIDGQEPASDRMGLLRGTLCDQHTIFVETTAPKTIAQEVLDEVQQQLADADQLRSEAVDQLSAGQTARAFERLSGIFTRWQHAQDSVQKVAQLLRVDLDQLTHAGQPLASVFDEFSTQLRGIKLAIEDRDFVTLNDALSYEMPGSIARWQSAVEVIRGAVEAG